MKLLYWPVRISDGAFFGWSFGEHPEAYVQFGLKGHNGQDFVIQAGKPVYASCDGFVLYRQDLDAQGAFKGFGNYARIENADGWTYYAHLSKFVGKDRQVKAGEVIGLIGSTGYSSGPHLHFGFRPRINDANNGYGGCVDPRQFLANENDLPVMNEAKIVKSKKSDTVYWCYPMPDLDYLQKKANLEGVALPNPFPDSDSL